MQNLIREFIELGYTPVARGPAKAQDTILGPYIVGRLDKNGYMIYYLFSGVSIRIPWKWIDLFGQFFVHSGHKVEHMGLGENSLDNFIYWMTKLQQNLMTKKDILETIEKICGIGTKEFRKTILDLPGIEYSEKNRQIEI